MSAGLGLCQTAPARPEFGLVTDLISTKRFGSGDALPATSIHGPIAVEDIFAI